LLSVVRYDSDEWRGNKEEISLAFRRNQRKTESTRNCEDSKKS